MADLVFLTLIAAFFGLAVLLVRACDRIIGPDPTFEDELEVVERPGEVESVA